MRKKNLRLLSFTLAAALVLSSANTGVLYWHQVWMSQ